MKILFTLMMILAIAVPVIAYDPADPNHQMSLCQVTRVIDGDTVVLDSTCHVRLVGIDAPEISHNSKKPDQPYGRAAKQHLEELLTNHVVLLRRKGIDLYGRTLGDFFIDNQDVNAKMVQDGFAWNYRGGGYAEMEQEARAAHRGLWADPDPINPKLWRHPGVTPPLTEPVPSK